MFLYPDDVAAFFKDDFNLRAFGQVDGFLDHLLHILSLDLAGGHPPREEGFGKTGRVPAVG